MKLWNYIKEAMLKNPTQTIGEEAVTLTYEETVIYAETMGEKLRGEACCTILCASEMMAALSLLACLAANVTAIPLSFRYGNAHVEKILNYIRPSVLLSDCVGKLEPIHLSESNYITPKRRPALIMFTSGTTGAPKGIMLSEENIMTNVTDIVSYFAIGSSDTILIARPLYHCAVLTGEFLTALVKGSKIFFSSESFNPVHYLESIEKYNATAFCGTPTLLSLMARCRRKGKNYPLRHIVVSGECMNKSTGNRIAGSFPDAEIYHVYGLTEACPRVSYLPPKHFREHPDAVGVPLPSVKVKIISRNGRLAKVNEEGMLWVKGKNIMQGYYRNRTLTHNALRNGWLRTGDIAVIDKNGFLRIKGRSDNLIIRGGMNIYPQEIEGTLKQDARVREVLVYGFSLPDKGNQIGMKLAGDFHDADEVRKLCIELLPRFAVPTAIELVDELPKNGSGKIIRNKN